MKFIKKQHIVALVVLIVGATSAISLVNVFKSNFSSEKQPEPIINRTPNEEDKDKDKVPTVEVEQVVTRSVDEDITKLCGPYGKNDSEEEQQKSLYRYGNSYAQYLGVVYQSSDNTPFEVRSILDGVVTEVDNTYNSSIITIEYDNSITVTYNDISDSTLNVGDSINQDDVIGSSSISTRDLEAGNSVYIQARYEDKIIDVESIVGLKPSQIK